MATISKVVFTIHQGPNTMGTTGESEDITVEVESQTGDVSEDGTFLVIRTDGWSVDDNELTELLLAIRSKVVSLANEIK